MTSRFTLFAITGLLSLSFASNAVAKDVVSPVSLLLKEQSKNSTPQKRRARSELSIDELNLDLKADKGRCEKIEKVLTENYGPPTSNRRNLRIWELPNTDKANGQSKMITIMAGEENGRYFVKLDRKGPTRGNNPRLNRTTQSQSTTTSSRARPHSRQKIQPYERD